MFLRPSQQNKLPSQTVHASTIKWQTTYSDFTKGLPGQVRNRDDLLLPSTAEFILVASLLSFQDLLKIYVASSLPSYLFQF